MQPKQQMQKIIVFGGMIADMVSNKRLNGIITELLSTGWKLNISLIFITQSCFTVKKNSIELNSIG